MRSYKRAHGQHSRADWLRLRELKMAQGDLDEELSEDVTVVITLTPLSYRILLSLQIDQNQRRSDVVDQLLREHADSRASSEAAA